MEGDRDNDLQLEQVQASTQTSHWLLHDLVKEQHKHHHKKEKKVTPWARLHPLQKFMRLMGIFCRIAVLFGILYIFICSLGLLEDAFKMLGGRAAGEAFQNSELLSNPIAGLMIGVLATVLVQSSSTATSIVVAMVAAQVIPLRAAIPIIMGTNVGTSVTSTLVSLAQAGEREEFRRAFSGATVHDMFNWSAVIVLLPLEVATGFLYHLTGAIVESMKLNSEDYKIELLTALTRPFTELIIEVNKDVITDIAMAPNATEQSSVMKRWCKITVVAKEVSVMRYEPFDCRDVPRTSVFYDPCTHESTGSMLKDKDLEFFVARNATELVNNTIDRTRCPHLFAQTDLSDTAAGAILLVVSIVVILLSLFGIVKVLNAMLQGPVAKMIHKTVNADFPGRWSYLTGYVAILVGCGLTIIIQSSSVFTSTLTPLVGVGIVTVERMYPMTLGSNIGTTVTGILAAMSTKGGHLAEALHIALCHLFFNISAVLLFYPIPFTRFPIALAKILGKVTSKYRWFAGFYLAFMFVILPCIIFALSYAGWMYLAFIGGPIFLLFLIVVFINVLQVKKPHWLPKKLQNWDFLPLFLHSCGPVDRIISCSWAHKKCRKHNDYESDSENENENDNECTKEDVESFHNGKKHGANGLNDRDRYIKVSQKDSDIKNTAQLTSFKPKKTSGNNVVPEDIV